jgi:hypothetical protein
MQAEIPKTSDMEQKVLHAHNEKDFISIALELYQIQFQENQLYQDYCHAINRTPEKVKVLQDLPFLPISFFKTHRVETGAFAPALVFRSSGTTGMATSNHFIKDPGLYEKSFTEGFRRFYGAPSKYCILGLLPSYLERGDSSLVYMVDRLQQLSGHPKNGFYLNEKEELNKTLRWLEAEGQPTILFGVTYALLDFAATHPQSLRHTIVIETGGMKGREKEITRAELYERLRSGLGLEEIHSEYGMTELLSQAYSINGFYLTPPWMKVCLRDESDPLSVTIQAERSLTGAINVIDLANLYSCSFIATEDVGKLYPGGEFEVLGRRDGSDLRGCSLMGI